MHYCSLLELKSLRLGYKFRSALQAMSLQVQRVHAEVPISSLAKGIDEFDHNLHQCCDTMQVQIQSGKRSR
eukprot:6649272-Heterocapsa_arctica.AAC.1